MQLSRFTLAISKDRTPFLKNYWLIGCLTIFIAIWVSTLTGTSDINNWLLENILVIIFSVILFATYRKYQFSDLSYLLICIYMCLHVYGSKYTYAENPFGYWLMEVFDTSRNHYDRIVHFSFGFLLAYPLREVFLIWVKLPRWLSWASPIEVALSMGAFYELIEWAVADVFFKEQGAAYLGTQGDIWDAQKDIFLAFLGALIATSIVSLIKRSFNIYEPDIEG